MKEIQKKIRRYEKFEKQILELFFPNLSKGSPLSHMMISNQHIFANH